MSDGTTNQTKFYIGPVSASETTISAYAALSWVEVTGLDALPAFGAKDNVIKYTTIDDNTVNKKKGATDYGSGNLVVIDRDSDTGQIAMKAAQASKYGFSFKVVWPTANSAVGTDGIAYYHAIVTSDEPMQGSADQPLKRTFGLELVDAPLYVAAT